MERCSDDRGRVGAPEPAATDDHGVVVAARPPVVYLTSILLGVALHAAWPVPVAPRGVAPFGALLMLFAVALFVLSAREFRTAGTPIRTRKPVTAMLTTGPYRFSRNPVYLSFTLLQLGLGIWIDSLWVVGLLVPTLVLLSYGVIDREERYMTQKFGDEYRRYRGRVRRWL